MTDFQTNLPPHLQAEADRLWNKATEVGLDMFTTVFEVVDYQQLNEIAAYGGFPTRYPHWRWGMEYESLSKSYTYGLSKIYEMVINNDPCYAYLLRSNTEVSQRMVIAHVYGHCDFFKNNYWFSKTNRKMLDQMANDAAVVRNIINEVGQSEVEDFIDVCLSMENLIDVHSVFRPHIKSLTDKEKEDLAKKNPSKLKSKKYMDHYINPQEYLEDQKRKILEDAEKQTRVPDQPERDILHFLIQYAPMSTWQRRIMEMIRAESYYFAPQGQTKIINEGWASYWHSKMMTEIDPVGAEGIIDYCCQHAGVVANQPNQLNPYKLGIELLRHIENRWDEGRFGVDYLNCDDHKVRESWEGPKEAGAGRKKIFEVRKFHNDVTFLDQYLDEDFCHKTKMFLYDYDQKTGDYIISSRDFRSIKQKLLQQIINLGAPVIHVVDGNFRNRGELLLQHRYDGEDLKQDSTIETLKNLQKVWKRPVHLETMIEKTKHRLCFDGNTQSSEKI